MGQCVKENIAFTGGEKIEYEISYNLGFVWLNVGLARFTVDSVIYQNKHALHLRGYGTSYRFYDWAYKVRDHYDAFIDPYSIEPFKFKRDIEEGKYFASNVYYFNHEKETIYSQTKNSNKKYSLDTIPLPDCTYDILSMIYYCRNIDYSIYQAGEKIPIKIILDGKIHDLYVRYLGKEVIKTRDRKKFQCIVFKPLLVQGGMFDGGENMTVWVTDDLNKIPVLIEAKILVGSIKAYLTDLQGVRNNKLARID